MAPACRAFVRSEPSHGALSGKSISNACSSWSKPVPSLQETGMMYENGRSDGSITAARSCLFKIAIASGASSAAPIARRSSSVSGLESSTTNSAASQSFAASIERSTPIFSITSCVSRMPAVSTSRTRCRPSVTVCSTVSRVVPGMSVTITRSKPDRRLRRLDFPAFGLPRMTALMPDCTIRPRWQEASSAVSCRLLAVSDAS